MTQILSPANNTRFAPGASITIVVTGGTIDNVKVGDTAVDFLSEFENGNTQQNITISNGISGSGSHTITLSGPDNKTVTVTVDIHTLGGGPGPGGPGGP